MSDLFSVNACFPSLTSLSCNMLSLACPPKGVKFGGSSLGKLDPPSRAGMPTIKIDIHACAAIFMSMHAGVGSSGIGRLVSGLYFLGIGPVSYTHLTLPTNREV